MLHLLSVLQAISVNSEKLQPALYILTAILVVMLLSSVIFTLCIKRKGQYHKLLLGALYCVTLIVLVCFILCFKQYRSIKDDTPTNSTNTPQNSTSDIQPPSTDDPTEPSDTKPTEPTPTEPIPTFTPEYTDSSNPENWGVDWEIIQSGSIVDSFDRTDKISFGSGYEYTELEGIITFRGDNYRSGATYGTANVVNKTISSLWNRNIGSLNGWPGSGWTGQPLIVKWPEETKQIMNIKEEKKAKEGLVEIIYATLDGYIYFYDLDDGSYTRDPVFVGMNFKGAGSLDPRGYPLMYVGSGDYYSGKTPRMYIISLIDGSILYEKSGSDSFTLRKDWAAFDSSPLIDSETDTLIWPGESGILYTIKLNSEYDPTAGTISINPEEIVKTRYTTSRSNGGTYWLGYEPSAVIVDRYLYTSENGGMFFCIDLDTMELVWAQDTKDDSNSTPVFEWDESGETGYIYTAPSLHWTADSSSQGELSIYKLNAKTGEIIWEYKYDCHTVSGVSGGVQSTPLLGKKGTELEGIILYTIARTPNAYNGVLIALDTATGEIVWQKPMDNYTWSSPVAIYTESGEAYIILCDSLGNVFLVDSADGTTLSTINIGSNIEASPAVFGNILVVGTRGQRIYGIKVE